MFSPQQVIGHHELSWRLGVGPFAEVWLATELELGVRRALKVPTDPFYAARLRDQRELPCAIVHPNIVQALELDTDHEPPSFAMEYVEGEDLRTHLARVGRVPIDETLRVVGQALEAVREAHRRGVIHCDLKPENLLVTPHGTVKVADFGLGALQAALVLELLERGRRLPRTRHGGAEPHEYMSPQQRAREEPTPSDDLYALGVITCELIAGRRPADGLALEPLLRKRRAAPAVIRLVERALSGSPYPNADEMLAALRQAEAETPTGRTAVLSRTQRLRLAETRPQDFRTRPPRPQATPQPPQPTGGRRLTRIAALLCGLLILGLAAFLGIRHFTRPHARRSAARARGPVTAPASSSPAASAQPTSTARPATHSPTSASKPASQSLPAIKVSQPDLLGLPKEIVHVQTGIRLVRIAAGTFVMGDDAGQGNDAPAHQVTIRKAFYLGRFEVTQAQYRKVMEENPSRYKGDARPVESVSFADCIRFCERAGLRLPTEAEWEHAARCLPVSDPPTRETVPVHTLQHNALGLTGMLGNVAEWCGDVYADYRAAAATDPRGPDDGPYRVVRGGWYTLEPAELRLTMRRPVRPLTRSDFIGFRVALDAARARQGLQAGFIEPAQGGPRR